MLNRFEKERRKGVRVKKLRLLLKLRLSGHMRMRLRLRLRLQPLGNTSLGGTNRGPRLLEV